jgi:hypothetical protein
VIYELEISQRSSVSYAWILLRFPIKIDEGWSQDLTSILLEPLRRKLVGPADSLAITLDSIAVGIYAAPTVKDEAARLARDIVAILRS